MVGAGSRGGPPRKKGSSGRSYRAKTGLTIQPKNMRGRKPSSNRWLTRQLNDPFVAEAQKRGYRSRAALKLEQMDDKHKFLRPHAAVVDLGCAPGGWLQVVSRRCKLDAGKAKLVGIDLLATDPVAGAQIFEGDITDETSLDMITSAIGGKADIVLSDMAAATTGHRQTDHLRTMALLEIALDFAEDVLTQGGTFLAKAFRGGADGDFMTSLNQRFEKVRYLKPAASRAESVETYLLATGYRRPEDAPEDTPDEQGQM
ncbi:MAG: RlmE family RNA methyltransferase [Candidatus Puniceispirillaceae bacterium]